MAAGRDLQRIGLGAGGNQRHPGHQGIDATLNAAPVLVRRSPVITARNLELVGNDVHDGPCRDYRAADSQRAKQSQDRVVDAEPLQRRQILRQLRGAQIALQGCLKQRRQRRVEFMTIGRCMGNSMAFRLQPQDGAAIGQHGIYRCPIQQTPRDDVPVAVERAPDFMVRHARDFTPCVERFQFNVR